MNLLRYFSPRALSQSTTSNLSLMLLLLTATTSHTERDQLFIHAEVERVSGP